MIPIKNKSRDLVFNFFLDYKIKSLMKIYVQLNNLYKEFVQ